MFQWRPGIYCRSGLLVIVWRLGDQHVGVHYRVWVGGWLWVNMGLGWVRQSTGLAVSCQHKKTGKLSCSLYTVHCKQPLSENSVITFIYFKCPSEKSVICFSLSQWSWEAGGSLCNTVTFQNRAGDFLLRQQNFWPVYNDTACLAVLFNFMSWTVMSVLYVYC